MYKMRALDIQKLLDALIGDTVAIGDEAIDRCRTESLKMLVSISDWCVAGIVRSAQRYNHNLQSIRDNGEIALNALHSYSEYYVDIMNGDT